MRLNSNEVGPPSITFCRLISYSRSHEKQMSGTLSKVCEGIGLPHIERLLSHVLCDSRSSCDYDDPCFSRFNRRVTHLSELCCVLALSATKEGVLGSFCRLHALPLFSSSSSFLPQSKNMRISLIRDSKLHDCELMVCIPALADSPGPPLSDLWDSSTHCDPD